MVEYILKELTIQVVYENDPKDNYHGYGLKYWIGNGDIGQPSGWARIPTPDDRLNLDNSVKAKEVLTRIYDYMSQFALNRIP